MGVFIEPITRADAIMKMGSDAVRARTEQGQDTADRQSFYCEAVPFNLSLGLGGCRGAACEDCILYNGNINTLREAAFLQWEKE